MKEKFTTTLFIVMFIAFVLISSFVSANDVTSIPNSNTSTNNTTNSSSSSSTNGNTTTNTTNDNTTTDSGKEENKVSTNEKGYIIAEIYVINNTTGLGVGYAPPESGGTGELLNTDIDYSNCSFEMIVPNNYGKTINTDFGTFTYKEKTQYDYRYNCPVNPNDIKSRIGEFDLIFTATNIDTNKVETLDAWFLFYKIGFKNNANLKVGNTDFIVNGKIEKDVVFMSENSSGKAVYDESRNRLNLFNYNGTITYSNMGETFKIEKDGNCDVEIICEDNDINKETVSLTDSTTNIKLSATNGTLPTDTKLTVNKITNGSTYMLVENTLKDITSKLYIYDITLTSNETKIQPNGKVKISIPIPNDIDTSKLAIYRIVDNGEKTEYKVTVETIGNTKYATFETDHFSTYVLAETTSTSTNQDNTVAKGKLPQTGVGIGLTIGLIVCVGIATFVYLNYRRYKDI